MHTFYLAKLICSATGSLLASEEVWSNDTPERVALDAATFFNTDEHDQDPAGHTIRLYGPYTMDEAAPAHVFKVEEAEEPADEFWTVTEVAADEKPPLSDSAVLALVRHVMATGANGNSEPDSMDTTLTAVENVLGGSLRSKAEIASFTAQEVASALGYTVKPVEGGFIFNDPDGNDAKDAPGAPYTTEAEAWAAAEDDAADRETIED